VYCLNQRSRGTHNIESYSNVVTLLNPLRIKHWKVSVVLLYIYQALYDVLIESLSSYQLLIYSPVEH